MRLDVGRVRSESPKTVSGSISWKADIPFSEQQVRWIENSSETKAETIHFNGNSTNAELLFCTVNYVNRLSICGAVSDRYEELAQQIPAQASSCMCKDLHETT